MRAVEYHDSRTLSIEGSDRVRRGVLAILIGSTGVKMDNIQPPSFFDIDDDEAEDAAETLPNELDHWRDVEESNFDSGN